MNPADVLNFETTVISSTLAINQTVFSEYINLEFIPDQVVLKTLSVLNASTQQPENYMLRSSLIDDKILLSVPDAGIVQETYNNPYKCQKPINSTFNFRLVKIDNTPFTHDGLLHISITLLFIKWNVK